jgi:hypothetical protein
MLSLTVNVAGPKRPRILGAKLAAAVRAGGIGPLRPYYRRAGAAYLAFVRRRYIRAGRGDGTWPDLSPFTKYRRLWKRKNTRPAANAAMRAARASGNVRSGLAAALAGHKFTILQDTSTLFGSLTEGSPGNVLNYTANGIAVGTAVRYGKHHQHPLVPGKPPERKFLVEPDAATNALIRSIFKEAAAALLAEE